MTTRRRKAPIAARPGEVEPTPHVPLAVDWQAHETWRCNGRVLVRGTEVTITDERGRFRFLRAVTRPNGIVWLDFIGGPQGAESWRSFRPERVRAVHIKAKTRANAA